MADTPTDDPTAPIQAVQNAWGTLQRQAMPIVTAGISMLALYGFNADKMTSAVQSTFLAISTILAASGTIVSLASSIRQALKDKHAAVVAVAVAAGPVPAPPTAAPVTP